ncbi:MAG TPA: HAD-IB family phosphatase [Polyangia bacterium]|jgi:2-hydroxy-3-keto-5-methylthiopentenyl-1-phosphate phosphatase|nr:HAD-IB family phosphatase [Polyangia bacterium]
MIIVSDFDGTLTLDDVTTFVWDKYLGYDWRAKLLPPTYEGRWTPLEMIAHGYGDIRVPPKELLAEIRDNVRMRPGVEALGTFCRGRGWIFAVVSHGLSFYIEALLPSWIPFTSFVGTFNEWSWRVALPPTMVLRPGEDFKSRVVADLRTRYPGRQTVYLGDGRLDLAAALTCDRIFAVGGSSLADLVRVTGRSVEEFESLDEVAASL